MYSEIIYNITKLDKKETVTTENKLQDTNQRDDIYPLVHKQKEEREVNGGGNQRYYRKTFIYVLGFIKNVMAFL
jgi:hypothetical protein